MLRSKNIRQDDIASKYGIYRPWTSQLAWLMRVSSSTTFAYVSWSPFDGRGLFGIPDDVLWTRLVSLCMDNVGHLKTLGGLEHLRVALTHLVGMKS